MVDGFCIGKLSDHIGLLYISRNTVVCHATKKASDHTMSIFQEERKQLFHVCIPQWPLLQSTPFLHYSCHPSRVRHTENLIKFATAFARYGCSKFPFFFFLCRTGATGASISFRTLIKNCYKMQTCNSSATIFGTNKESIMVDSRTKFVVNLSNIQGVMSVYSCKKRPNVCHGYRVNQV